MAKDLPVLSFKMQEALKKEFELQTTNLRLVFQSMENAPEIAIEIQNVYGYLNGIVGQVNVLSDETLMLLPDNLWHKLESLESLCGAMWDTKLFIEEMHNFYQESKEQQ